MANMPFNKSGGVNHSVSALFNLIKSKPGLRIPELANHLETPQKPEIKNIPLELMTFLFCYDKYIKF